MDLEKNGISRRSMLKRIGAGAAIAWTAPVLTSIRTPALGQQYTACTACQFENCGEGPCVLSDCFCATTTQGDCFCGQNAFCSDLPDCSNVRPCPAGWRCIPTSGCSPRNVCVPPCGTCAPGESAGTAAVGGQTVRP